MGKTHAVAIRLGIPERRLCDAAQRAYSHSLGTKNQRISRIVSYGMAIASSDFGEISTMNTPATLDILHDIQIANDLSEANRQLLANCGRVVELAASETIFREGEKHRFVYWLVDGRVSLEMSTGGTAPKLLLTLGRSDLLAWSAILSGGRMTSTATTTDVTRLLAFDAKQLNELCRRNHEIGYQVMEHFARQLAMRLLATRMQLLDLYRHPSESDR